MSIIVGWTIAGICIALFVSFVCASLLAAVESMRHPQWMDEPRRETALPSAEESSPVG